MKYRLKDKKLAEHFRAIYPDFEEKLDEACKDQIEDKYDCILMKICRPTQERHDVLFFLKEEVESVPAYDPSDWNAYPLVTPPEDVWMRIETYDGRGLRSFYKAGRWLSDTHEPLESAAKRFRPWED